MLSLHIVGCLVQYLVLGELTTYSDSVAPSLHIRKGFEDLPRPVCFNFDSNSRFFTSENIYSEACYRAAVHGLLQGGIHGKVADGAYSVVLSGGWDEDEDKGDTL